jgi:glycosyltransferase involved in cell wall biosynthesis
MGTGRAIAGPASLVTDALTEGIVSAALEETRQGSRVILWGNYLWIYGRAVLAASSLLRAEHGITLDTWITPTGSDIWEIGPQLPQVTSRLLNSRLISSIVVYSRKFAGEIAERFHLRRPYTVIPPALDNARFHPVGRDIKDACRARLGIPVRNFVISSHSNMRPVKAPEDVLATAEAVALLSDRQVTLLMIGPRPSLRTPSARNKCQVIWTGVQRHVEEYLWASDVELNCSLHDSFNLSLLEAMGCGLPCTTTDVVGIADEIIECEGGYVYALNTYKSGCSPRVDDGAVRYLLGLVNNASIACATGLRAAKFMKSVFSPNAIAKSYENLLEKPSDANRGQRLP